MTMYLSSAGLLPQTHPPPPRTTFPAGQRAVTSFGDSESLDLSSVTSTISSSPYVAAVAAADADEEWTTIVPASRIAAATDVIHLTFAFFIASLSRIAYEMGRSGRCIGGALVVGEVGADLRRDRHGIDLAAVDALTFAPNGKACSKSGKRPTQHWPPRLATGRDQDHRVAARDAGRSRRESDAAHGGPRRGPRVLGRAGALAYVTTDKTSHRDSRNVSVVFDSDGQVRWWQPHHLLGASRRTVGPGHPTEREAHDPSGALQGWPTSVPEAGRGRPARPELGPRGSALALDNAASTVTCGVGDVHNGKADEYREPQYRRYGCGEPLMGRRLIDRQIANLGRCLVDVLD
jgi:hypothetical protein